MKMESEISPKIFLKPNEQRFNFGFKEDESSSLAQINKINSRVKNILVLYEEAKEYISWLSKRYGYNFQTKMVGENIKFRKDIAEFVLEAMLKSDEKYQVIICESSFYKPSLINKLDDKGTLILKINSDNLDQVLRLSKTFSSASSLYPESNTKFIYVVFEGFGEKSSNSFDEDQLKQMLIDSFYPKYIKIVRNLMIKISNEFIIPRNVEFIRMRKSPLFNPAVEDSINGEQKFYEFGYKNRINVGHGKYDNKKIEPKFLDEKKSSISFFIKNDQIIIKDGMIVDLKFIFNILYPEEMPFIYSLTIEEIKHLIEINDVFKGRIYCFLRRYHGLTLPLKDTIFEVDKLKPFKPIFPDLEMEFGGTL